MRAAFGTAVWDLVGSAAGAKRHGVDALLHVVSPSDCPPKAELQFRAAFRIVLAENLQYLSVTQEICSLLTPHLSVLPIKGVLFGSRFYPHMGCRRQSDVDILVKKADLPKAHGLLIDAGWKEAVPRDFYKDHYHWVYEHEASGVLLELHWAFKFPGTTAPDIHRVWDLSREMEIEGIKALQMRDEDLLEYMAVNKAMQHYPTLADFVDLHYLVEKTDLDWDVILFNAGVDDTSGAVWFGLHHCKDLLGTRIPDKILTRLAEHPSARGARGLRKLIAWRGGVLNMPPHLLEGPAGRVYEAFLEGRPGAVGCLLKPLVLPSKARVEALGQGSYFKYFFRKIAGAGRQAATLF